MAKLPAVGTPACHKVFPISVVDFLGHVHYVQGRSTWKAWSLFTCTSSRAVLGEIVNFLALKIIY